MLNSFVIALTFISIIPVPKTISWNSHTLRYFCVMLPVVGVLFGALWIVAPLPEKLSPTLRGFMMMLYTLALTGGLHMDGLMDTCDAVFSHRDRETRLRILSDTHAGSFAVMGCVAVMMAKTLLFAELHNTSLFFVPVYSRLGMAALLNNLPFAKTGGLAVMLGSSRNKRDNVLLLMMFVVSAFVSGVTLAAVCAVCCVLWAVVCVRIFGGITGDLCGAFVELSEVIMLVSMLLS